MGLDGIELLLAIEEEFGVDIPDHDAESMITVGLTYEWLKARIAATGPIACLTQRIFYKLRRALIDNYGLNRQAIRPDTRLTDVLSFAEVEAGWPFLQMFIDLETPPFKTADEFFGFRQSEKSLTMRELVDSLISLNSKKLTPQVDTESEIWNRLVKVILRQLNVSIEDVVPEASYVRDLGVD